MVSVVIPAYNRRKFIAETVDSVLAQTYQELEIIVVDDGSTDGTGEYLKNRYAGESRFRYLWQENAERSVARNTGVKAAKGEYVAFLDSDDLWLPEKLSEQMRLLLDNPEMVMAVTWFEFMGQKYETLQTIESPAQTDCTRENFCLRMVAENRIGSPTPLIKRQVLFDAGLFCLDSKVLCFEDWELWTRVSFFGKVGVVPKVLARHRIHPGNTEKPLMPDNYIASIANMKKMLGRVFWSDLRDSAMNSYWAQLRNHPPCNLYRRTKAIFAGVNLFGIIFCSKVIIVHLGDCLRFLIGPVTLHRLRRVRA